MITSFILKYADKVYRFVHAKNEGFYNYVHIRDKSRSVDEKYLLVDITVIREFNNITGIQRVTKNILNELYKTELPYKVREVYAKRHGAGFFYADTDKPVKIARQDFFFGLDLSVYYIPMNRIFLKKMKLMGIPVFFFIHDMIPVNFPQTVEEGIRKNYPRWLKTIINFTGIIGNSQATINDLKKWINKNYPSKFKKLIIEYVHLGSDLSLNNIKKSLERKDTPLFLMVGTVEPRKKYDQAVQAFKLLWKKKIKAKLIIVGKSGWNNEDTVKLIRDTISSGYDILWYDKGINDKQLSELYLSASALLFTSEAEGFGIPIVEAASYNIPLILRDIPVFREIADDSALYFSGNDPQNIEDCLEEWLMQYKNNSVIYPEKIKYYTWKECTKELIKKMRINQFSDL